MIYTIHGLCFSFAVVGIQIAISKYVAAKKAQNDTSGMFSTLKSGLIMSLVLSLLATIMLYISSDFISIYLLNDIRCSNLLKIASLSLPLCAIHCCIGGYYMGNQKASVPAWSQMVEQLVRVGAIYIIAKVIVANGYAITPEIASWGLVIGEAASTLYCIIAILIEKGKIKNKTSLSISESRSIAKSIFSMAYPLTLNRIIVGLITSLEAILIPFTLRRYGMSHELAISLYGILTGMAIPLILFPSTITNSISAMILPSVSEAQSAGNIKTIQNTATKAIKYSIAVGIFCSGYFYIYGESLGLIFFNDVTAGTYISILAWICPFLYLTSTLSSILNGMGLTKITFIHNMIAAVARIVFIIIFIPIYGIKGCLWGILAGQILCSILHAIYTFKECRFYYNPFDFIIKPLFTTALALGISLFSIYTFSNIVSNKIIILCISFIPGFLIFGRYIYVDSLKAK